MRGQKHNKTKKPFREGFLQYFNNLICRTVIYHVTTIFEFPDSQILIFFGHILSIFAIWLPKITEKQLKYTKNGYFSTLVLNGVEEKKMTPPRY